MPTPPIIITNQNVQYCSISLRSQSKSIKDLGFATLSLLANLSTRRSNTRKSLLIKYNVRSRGTIRWAKYWSRQRSRKRGSELQDSIVSNLNMSLKKRLKALACLKSS
jgi:hypothetical protein